MSFLKKQNVYLCYTYKSWHMFLPLMNSFNKTLTAIFPCKLCTTLLFSYMFWNSGIMSWMLCTNTVPPMRNEASVVWHISFRITWWTASKLVVLFTHAGYAFFGLSLFLRLICQILDEAVISYVAFTCVPCLNV